MTWIDTPSGWVRRLGAVIVAMTAATAVLVGVPAPAGAAACSSSSGVSVVVDFTGATGGVQSACVAGGANRPADEVISTAGFALTWVSRHPGFVCRVNGVPAEDPCVNTPPPDAYWGVFWSDGTDGTWHYADIGVNGLQVPDGGYIGLAWQTGTRRVPGQAPTVHPVVTPTTTPTTAPSPTSTGQPSSGTTKPSTSGGSTPTAQPTKGPTRTPTTSPTTAPTSTDPQTSSATPPVESSSSAAAPSSSATTTPPSKTPVSSATATPSSSVTEPTTSEQSSPSETPTTTEPRAAEEESGRVPTWLTLAILAMLLVAIGMSAYAARRRTRS